MKKYLALLLCFTMALSQIMAQNRTITGKITDEKGNPVPHASVVVKGSAHGTTTDAEGNFSLNVHEGVKAIVVSSVNFAAVEINITGKSTIAVSLTESKQNLDEVVVTGYGTQKKYSSTSAQTRVGGDKVENVPFASVDQTLQGKVAGLQSITSSGQPGTSQAIRIRGIGSISASAQPLFVVDGVQIEQGNLSTYGNNSNAISGINPDDIEQIDVLKDAAATSIYGSRGSNGVILITTKRGKAGKLQLKASAEVGNNRVATITNSMKPLRSKDWLTLLKEGMQNAGTYTDATITTYLHTYGDTSNINTDWFNLLTRTGTQQQYNISASGGDEKNQVFTSLGYFNQDASTIASNLKRYNGRLSIRNSSLKNTVIDFSFSGSFQDQNAPLQGSGYFSNPMLAMYFLRPTQNPFNADGSYNTSTASATSFAGSLPNPLYVLAKNIYNQKTVQAKPVVTVDYSIIKGLKFQTKFGVDYNGIENFTYYNPVMGDGSSVNGRGYAGYERDFLYDWTNQLNYHADFLNKDLTADFKVGTEAISDRIWYVYGSAYSYSTDKLTDLANASTYSSLGSDHTQYNFSSSFSNAVFSFKKKYSLTGSIRRDGSSRFGSDNKYGTFYSVGGGWNITDEDFMKYVKPISFLKLRSSFGLQGNAEIGNSTAPSLQNSGYNYNGVAGTAFETIGNETLTWEQGKQFDIGTEVGFLNNRLNVVFDYYNKNTNKLLYTAPVSLTTGFSSKTANIGGLQNRGIELTINATPIKKRDFSWDISANFTHNKNKITKLPNNNADIVSGMFRLRVGQDYRSFYTYQWAGVDPSNGNPLWYTDSSKKATTSTYASTSKAYLNKSASPKFYGGISNTFTYKNFSLGIDINYNFGNYVYDTYASYLTDGVYAATYGRYSSNLRRWTTVGQKTDVPKYVYGSTNKSNSTSSRYIYSGDYIRLRNVELAYNAPKAFLNKARLTSMRLYVRASNLYTWIADKNIPFDPEQGVNSTAAYSFFQNKATTVGLSVGF